MDASAILAFLNQESGSEQITDLIENATIGTINLFPLMNHKLN
nr:hypothetical protein [Spirulina subsalsa]